MHRSAGSRTSHARARAARASRSPGVSFQGLRFLAILAVPAVGIAGEPAPQSRPGQVFEGCTIRHDPQAYSYDCGAYRLQLVDLDVPKGVSDATIEEVHNRFGGSITQESVALDLDGKAVKADAVAWDATASTPPKNGVLWHESLDDYHVRLVLCESASDLGWCEQRIAWFAQHGPPSGIPLELPEAMLAPPLFASARIALPAGCERVRSDAWPQAVRCDDGSALAWRETPLPDGSTATVDSYADYATASLGADAASQDRKCWITQDRGTCREWYAGEHHVVVVTEGGTSMSCDYSAADARDLPAVCAPMMKVR
jgi:hypothetical protein